MPFIAILLAGLFFGIGWVTSCDSQMTKEDFIRTHELKPYCIDESATVMGKTIHNKRCWQVTEIRP